MAVLNNQMVGDIGGLSAICMAYTQYVWIPMGWVTMQQSTTYIYCNPVSYFDH